MERGYEDAYRQFIEPVVGASGEHLAQSGAECCARGRRRIYASMPPYSGSVSVSILLRASRGSAVSWPGASRPARA